MFCRACGGEIEAGFRFCGERGDVITSRATAVGNAFAPVAGQIDGKHACAATNSASAALPFTLRAHGRISAVIFVLVLVCSFMPFSVFPPATAQPRQRLSFT